MTSAQHPLTVGSRFGPYRLDRLIGRGGMGEVYQAYDTVKDRTVAIKVLPARLAQDPVYRQRFQRESHAAARLREAHVIPIHDYGEIDGYLYIDMRLVDGDSLRQLLRSAGPGSPERTVGLIEQIASALDAAHSDGLLHRDIKPDNILLTRDGFAYLVDFGIAQSVTDPSLTADGSAVGSYHYMAPERFGSRELTPAADVYALAAVLYESLTGSRPFTGENDAQLMRAHLFDPPPKPSMVRSSVPATFDPVIARGMAKNPDDRYKTAGDLAAAARAALVPADPRPFATTTPVDMGPRQPTTGQQPVQISGPTQPVATANGTSTSPAQSPTGPPPPAPNSTDQTGGPGKRKGRARRVAGALGVLVLVAAALGFAGWAVENAGPSGTAIPDNTALQGPDIELLSMTDSYNYKRANCIHESIVPAVTAVFYCEANTRLGAPAARFWRFRSAKDLHDTYNSTVATFQATSCPGDPSGTDAPVLSEGKEIGRKTCFSSRVNNPAAPQPALAVTDESTRAMAIFFWSGPSETTFRDYAAKVTTGAFGNSTTPRDPDAFTDADRRLLAHTGAGYAHENCVHGELPPGPADALLACGTPRGAPVVTFFGHTDRKQATTMYQANLGQRSGHACGGTGSDDVWRKDSGPVGRYFCYTDTTEAATPRTCLLAVHEDLLLSVLTCTVKPDNPEGGPTTEAQLLTWFKKNFG